MYLCAHHWPNREESIRNLQLEQQQQQQQQPLEGRAVGGADAAAALAGQVFLDFDELAAGVRHAAGAGVLRLHHLRRQGFCLGVTSSERYRYHFLVPRLVSALGWGCHRQVALVLPWQRPSHSNYPPCSVRSAQVLPLDDAGEELSSFLRNSFALPSFFKTATMYFADDAYFFPRTKPFRQENSK